MKTGIIKAGEWLVIDAGLKSGRVLRQGRISGVKVVTRLASNFVVKRFGNSYRKDDILRDIKPIRRTIGDENYTIYPFKGCLWQGTMINLFLVRADGYDNYIPLITTSLNSKPETIIMKYEERFSIEMTFKELKSYLKIESNYFELKESNYGYLFLLCLVYNFIQYLRLYIHDKSFKDTLDGLSTYLLSKRPPKEININYLEQYPEFIDFRGSSKPGESELDETLKYEDTTPEELIGIGHQKLQDDLASKLMIEHDVGVSTIASYTIKKVDSDYFMEA